MEAVNVTSVVCQDRTLVSTIFSYLRWQEVLNARVCRSWRISAKLTPVAEILVETDAVLRDLDWITKTLPNGSST
eukprot:scaffold1992_cov187-Amphora_coffeaeformis.AAC.23